MPENGTVRDPFRSFLFLVILATTLKFLCFQLYHSTDMDVHRYWIALTGSVSWREWYTDENSEWTLDYPPLFALFQLFLYFLLKMILGVPFIPPSMTDGITEVLQFPPTTSLSSVGISTMRWTVILSDIVFLYALFRILRKQFPTFRSSPKPLNPFIISFFFVYFNIGLLMVDHIHFQYNGFLIGILLLSIVLLQEEQYCLAVASWSILVLTKHLFIVCGPLLFFYILYKHILRYGSTKGFLRFSFLCIVGLVIVGVSIVPFAQAGQLPSMMARLFPFHRGLCHSYWAPNFWALYTVADKALAKILSIFVGIHFPPNSAFTGTVGLFEHQVFYSVLPLACSILSLLSILPAIYSCWKNPHQFDLLLGIAHCLLSTFVFGYHIHEKAIIPIIILITLAARKDEALFPLQLLISTTGHASLGPLFFTPLESLIILLFQIISFLFHLADAQQRSITISSTEKIYYIGIAAIVFQKPLLPLLLPHFPFLPLLLTSVYCSCGITVSLGLTTYHLLCKRRIKEE